MKWLLSLSFLLLPISALAAVGFAQESVWLSHTPVIEGETVSIYAALTNGGSDTLTSVAYFRDNGIRIASIPVSLQSGDARIISVSWSPAAGKHSLAVELASSSVALAKGTETTTVTVEKPSLFNAAAVLGGTDAAASAAFTDSSAIQAQLRDLSPAVESTVKPLFTTLDRWRQSGSSFLETQTETAKTKAEVLGAQKEALSEDAEDHSKQQTWLTLSQMLYTVLIYIYTALQTVLAKAGLFFPLLAFLFFVTLWKLYRRFRGPRYSY